MHVLYITMDFAVDLGSSENRDPLQQHNSVKILNYVFGNTIVMLGSKKFLS